MPKTISNCEDPYTLYSTNQLTQTNQRKTSHLGTFAVWSDGSQSQRKSGSDSHARVSQNMVRWIFWLDFRICIFGWNEIFEVQIFVWFLFSCLIALVKTCLCFSFHVIFLRCFQLGAAQNTSMTPRSPAIYCLFNETVGIWCCQHFLAVWMYQNRGFEGLWYGPQQSKISVISDNCSTCRLYWVWWGHV